MDYEVHRLNLEAKKITKIRSLRNVSIGTFIVSIDAVITSQAPEIAPQIPGIKEIAAVIGTTSLYNIIKDSLELQSKWLDLRKDIFSYRFYSIN